MKWKDFQLSMALDLDLRSVILHTFVHHSSTFTYTPYLIENFNRRNFLWTDGRTYVRRADGRTFEPHFIRSTQKSRPKKKKKLTQAEHMAHMSRELNNSVAREIM